MRSQTLRSLLDGQYICEFAFPVEFAYLTDDDHAAWVNEWLSALDMRLARVCDDGAFFMAPMEMQPSDTAKIRDEFLRFRDNYGPFVRMLQMIRSAKDDFTLQPGEYLQHAELVQSINESASLSDQLRALIGTIRDTEARYTNAELVKRLLEHLRKDGYLVLVNEATEMYRSTGKITQLTQVLTFLAENTEIGTGETSETEVAETDDLFDQVSSLG
ncbi:condensin complex protein MksE [Rhodoferax fermentans]|uniref:Uncharacterized protein n=1 Tax=Rhodoferax fermentans TaxID=28066 RepID=A0A1T1AN23_RHOFE|nr:hypothetical protein [Rhodoferax fermentans]OOV05353.1 hypothetical protein RF819_00285 [Rhodoferax fermentans]